MSANVPTAGPTEVDLDVLAEGTMSVSQAVAFTGVPRSTLYEAMGRGELVYGKLGKRRLIPKRALLALLRKGLVVGQQ